MCYVFSLHSDSESEYATSDYDQFLYLHLEKEIVKKANKIQPLFLCVFLTFNSLIGRANYWLDTLPRGTITTLDKLKREFLDIYLPTAKYLVQMKEIISFNQQEGVEIYDTWERFKLLLKRCNGHKFLEMDIMQAFPT